MNINEWYKIRKNLEESFDYFSRKYKGKLTIIDGNIDITSCFVEEENIIGPKPIKEILRKNGKVIGFIVKGEKFLSKYQNNKNKPIFHNYKYLTKIKSKEIIVFSCLCVSFLKNTSFYEIYEFGLYKEIQGFKPRIVKRILNNILIKDNTFNPVEDSFFFYSDLNKNDIENKIKITKIWLKNILNKGFENCYTTSEKEIELIQSLIGKKKFNLIIKKTNYKLLEKLMYNSLAIGKIYETLFFLFLKFRTYKKYLEKP